MRIGLEIRVIILRKCCRALIGRDDFVVHSAAVSAQNNFPLSWELVMLIS